MKISGRFILFTCIGIFIAGIFFLYYKYFYKAPVNWTETYYEESKEPYGTYILFEMMNGASGKRVTKLDNPVSQFLERKEDITNSSYIFIGDRIFLDSTDASSLFNFANKGNNVFISSNSFPDQLVEKLFLPMNGGFSDSTKMVPDSSEVILETDTTSFEYETEYSDTLEAETIFEDSVTLYETKDSYPLIKFDSDTIVKFSFTSPHLQPGRRYIFKYLNNFNTGRTSWTYFNDSLATQNPFQKEILGINHQNREVFIRFKVGKGYIYFHSIPLSFTNLYVRQKVALEYVNKVFHPFSEGEIFWDNFHRSYRNTRSSQQKSPLKYLLSQPSLSWSWYLILAGALLYILFYAKRKQQEIPLRTPKVNTSLEFVETLALMFQKSNFGKIADIKARNLRIFIWERYKVSPDLPLNTYADQVAIFSGIEKTKIMLIFVLLKNLQHDYATNEEFLQYHELIRFFIKNCK